MNCASFLVFVLAAVLLGGEPQTWQFAVLFAFSAVMGLISLSFLKRIPEGETLEQNRVSSTPVPWLAIAGHPPFRKLLRMNLAWSAAYGGLTTFTVVFLKVEAGLSEGQILLLNSVSFLGGLSSLWFLGSRIDRLGSKPIMTFSLMTWLFIISGWLLLAGKVVSTGWGIVLALQFFMGLGAALVNMANTKLAMATIPTMGRSHFFALFSVVANLSLGLAPILWGLILDLVRPIQVRWHDFEWNRFSLFFILVILAFLVALAVCRRLEEPQAAGMEELLRDLLVESPQRFWVRFWPRN